MRHTGLKEPADTVEAPRIRLEMILAPTFCSK